MCSPVSNGWHIIRHNEEVRFCRWANQYPDGRKRSTKDEPAQPWELASDVRVRLADAQITEDVGVLVTAFWRALHAIAAKGVEASDDEQAARTTNLLKWTLSRQKHELMREVELSAQYLLTYGITCLHPTWCRLIGYQWREYSLQQLQAAAEAEQGAGSMEPGGVGPMTQLLNAILDPAREEEAVMLVQQTAAQMVSAAAEAAVGMKLAEELLGNYTLSPAKARKAVRELRTDGVTELPVPYVCKNDPSIKALKVFQEVFFRTSATDIQRARVFHLEWLTETELRVRGRMEGWDAKWVEEAAKNKGIYTSWSPETDDLDNRDGSGISLDSPWSFGRGTNKQSELIEVAHAFYTQVDEDGIPVNVHTVFSPHFGDGENHQDTKAPSGKGNYALHEMLRLEHGKLPYVVGCLENLSRRLIDSRGYPELMATQQREVKVQRDALIDSTSLSVLPPINKPDAAMQGDYVFGPGAQNIVRRGAEPTMMEIKTPGVPAAFNLMEVVKDEVDQQFGSLSEKVNPVRAQTRKQMLINTFLRMWNEALSQQFSLMQQFTTPEEFQRVTGATGGMMRGHALSREFDIQLSFDARDLDMEHLKRRFEVIQAMFAMDRNGVINSDRTISHGLRGVDPSLADEILDKDKMGATEKVFREVQDDIQKMMDGFQPKRLVDADPTAPARLQMAQQIAQTNPKVAQALQSDPQFAALAAEYMKNLEFAASQNQNKQVGRTGVKG